MRNMQLKPTLILKWSVFVVLIGVVLLMGRLVHSGLSAQQVRGSGPVPYTVILQETVYGPDGTSTVAARVTEAVRSDGSFVVRLAHKDETQATERTIYFASGIEVTINELAATKSTVLRKNAKPYGWLRDPSSNCINSLAGEAFTSPPEFFAGEERVAGHRTVKLTHDNVTRWLAVDYGCATVKDRADWGSQGYSEWNLVALIPGEPDPALFEVEQYKEVSPSERVLGSGKNRKQCGPETAELLRRLDEYYYRHRPGQ